MLVFEYIYYIFEQIAFLYMNAQLSNTDIQYFVLLIIGFH